VVVTHDGDVRPYREWLASSEGARVDALDELATALAGGNAGPKRRGKR
jgi:hypothetical protein